MVIQHPKKFSSSLWQMLLYYDFIILKWTLEDLSGKIWTSYGHLSSKRIWYYYILSGVYFSTSIM